MNNSHRFQNSRQFSNLFSQIRLKKRHTSLFSGICREIRTKLHQKFAEKMQIRHKNKNRKFTIHSQKMLKIFGWNFEIWAVQKYVNLVDLVKSFPASIYLQKSASIQPRTSLSKFGGKFNSSFIRLLRADRLRLSADRRMVNLEQILGEHPPITKCYIFSATVRLCFLPLPLGNPFITFGK